MEIKGSEGIISILGLISFMLLCFDVFLAGG